MTSFTGRAGTCLALGALMTLACAGGSQAQRPTPPETSLLGVTLLKSSFRDVLKKYGRPDEIQAGGPFVPSEGAPSGARAASGGGKGGPGMMGGSSPYGGGMGAPGMAGGSGGGGGKKATSKNGFPGQTGTGAAGPGGPGAMGGYPGMTGSPGMAGGASPYGGGAGLPGFAGGGGGLTSPGGEGPGLPGGGASGGSDANAEHPEYEATWWYHDKTNGLHKSFLFNKDGRVIQVQEYGYDKHHRGGKTRMGVGLGASLNQVLRTYGWSNDGANEGRNMIMRFGGDDKIAFQLVNNVVVGITVAVVKEATPAEPQQ